MVYGVLGCGVGPGVAGGGVLRSYNCIYVGFRRGTHLIEAVCAIICGRTAVLGRICTFSKPCKETNKRVSKCQTDKIENIQPLFHFWSIVLCQSNFSTRQKNEILICR